MKNKLQIIIAALCLAFIAAPAAPPPDSAGAQSVNVWVFFKDKGPAALAKERVSDRSAFRRRKAGFRDSESGRPVSGDYVREVERRGGALRTLFPWGNAASFSVRPSRLAGISALPFVKSVTPVAVYDNRKIGGAPGLAKSNAAAAKSATADNRGYDWHTDMVSVPLAHDYIRYKGLGAPGRGALMAFFDGGFRLDHEVFKRARDSSQVIAAYDFVDGDTLVADPDQVANGPRGPYYMNDRHGTQTLSLAAAFAPGEYMGTAFGAFFALARTEDAAVESRVEEDYWTAAVVWADSIGADIISSSLGYRSDYTDSTENYGYYDMDGATAVVSIAAAGAVARGIIVVNSMGNDGNREAMTLSAPADVDGVVSVGAVTENRTLSDFSSVGPTYDGRMKPEVVAPGSWVPLPEPYSGNLASYTYSSGTSFSAPIVSSVMALILQAHPGISAQKARERLYKSCSFATGQNNVNSRFGYGIPNAALALMDTNEIFLKITDSAKTALSGATVIFAPATGKADTAVADTAGNALIKAQKSALPAQIRVSYRDGRLTDTVTVASLPFARVIEMEGTWDNGLKVSPAITRKNGKIQGRYYFTGSKHPTPVSIMVTTLTGKKVWSKRIGTDVLKNTDGSVKFEWNVKSKGAAAAPGVYLIVVRQGYSVISERVVVSK